MELYEIQELVDSGQLLKPDPFDGDFPMRGSALAKCPREMGHLLRGMPRAEVTPRQKRTFEVGHQRGEALGEAFSLGLKAKHGDDPKVEWYEEYRCRIPTGIYGQQACAIFQKALEQAGGGQSKVPMAVGGPDDRLFILGSIDALFVNHKTKLIWVIDWKTKHSFGFKKLGDEGVDLSYLVQVGAYVKAMRAQFPGYEIRAAVYYEDKNDAKHKALEIDLESDDHLVDEYIQKNEVQLRNWLLGGPVPDPGYAPNDKGSLPWQCNYCSVGPDRGKCFDGVVDQRQAGKDIPSWKVPV